MAWLRIVISKLLGLFRRERFEQQLDDEVRSHLEMLTEENLHKGMAPEDARCAALRQFGNVARTKEECRETWSLRFIEELLQDVRYGLRQLRRNPGFTAVAVLTLALGIGANAAIFSVLYLDLIRPLPYPQANQLVMFGAVVPAVDSRPFVFGSSYLQLRNSHSPFQSMASWRPGVRGCNLAGPNAARLPCAQVESTFLPTFEIRPVLGRNFTLAEDRPGAPEVCLISYSMWQSRFGGNRHVLGTAFSVDGRPTRVIGVLPHNFEWPTLARVDILLPEKLPATEAAGSAGPVLRAYGRLKPGTTLAQARAQLQPFVERFIQSAPPMFRKEIRLGLLTVREDQVGSIRIAFWVLFGATLALLLLGVANVTDLLLARGEARQREFAIRTALGASRWRITRLQLFESTLLGLGGGIVGAGLAYMTLRACAALAPAGIPRIQQAHLGLPVAILIVGMSFISGLLCSAGSVAAVRRASLRLAGGVKYSPKGKLRPALVGLQVAVSLVLLAGAGLLLGTYRNIRDISLGMNANHVVVAAVNLDRQTYSQPGEAAEYFQRLQNKLSALPGVTGVAVSDSLPPGGPERSRPFFVLHAEGHPPFEKGTGGLVAWRAVTPGYFKILDIPIMKGRGFVASDRDPHVNAIILSKRLAARLFPDENAVGQRVQFTHPAGPWYEVVGVVANVKNAGLVRDADPEYYVVRRKEPNLGLEGFPGDLRHAFFLVRSPLAISGVERLVRRAISSVHPPMPATISPLDAHVNRMSVLPRFDATLTGLFAILGLLLAGIGLYGLVSYSVAQRTHEIGIRMALGAEKSDVLRMVIAQGLKLALIGVAIGIAGALALTRFLASMLYGVKPTDPITFTAVSLILIAVASLACYIPARRATKVDPMVALRYE